MWMVAVKEKELAQTDEQLQDRWSKEAIVFCPQCKTLQTVWVHGSKLMSTRKFSQQGDHIYHDCGSTQPCRLYQSW